jgi:hypothetical protein
MSEAENIGHWNGWIGGLQASSKEFYTQVEEAIGKREVPDCKIVRVSLSEGGFFSSSREYLRVIRKDLRFEICAAPFGDSFFVSWWLLYEQTGLWAFLASIPYLGFFFRALVRPLTYYQMDTANMFQSLVHDALLEVFEKLGKANGKRALGEAERRPVMKEFFAR